MKTETVHNEVLFPGVKDGETFTAGGFEFIKFPNVNGTTPVVIKDIAFRSSYGENNDLTKSRILKKMQKEILPAIIEAIGEENVLAFKTDLTTLDGLKPYQDLESRISLPTFDFYRANVEIFDKHNPNAWWWLATPESAKPHSDPAWIVCVAPSGDILYGIFYNFGSCGVRPFLIFNSAIFGSSEEEQ